MSRPLPRESDPSFPPARRIRSRWIGSLLAMVWFLLVPMGDAVAQVRMPTPAMAGGGWFGNSDEDRLMLHVGLGFADRVITNRWSPARLSVFSPTGEGFEGVLRLRVDADGRREAYEAPFALPPSTTSGDGRPVVATVFMGFIAPGVWSDGVRYEIEVVGRPLGTEERARSLQRAVLEDDPSGRISDLPEVMTTDAPLFLLVGSSSATNVHLLDDEQRGGRVGASWYARNQYDRPTFLVEDPSHLPSPASRWMLLDGYDGVVLAGRGLERLNEASREALVAWVRQGGHLVLIDNLMGAASRGLLPTGMIRPVIGEVSDSPGGDRAGGAVEIVPTSAGVTAGWGEISMRGVPPRRIVAGPVGLGRITVLSAEPRMLVESAAALGLSIDGDGSPPTDTEDLLEGLEPDGDDPAEAEDNSEESKRERAAARVWQRVLRIPQIQSVNSTIDEAGPTYYYGPYGGGNIGNERISRALDHAAWALDASPISAWWIGTLVVLIGLLVACGTTFGDWFLLRTPKRRRISFLTAMGWLVAGSGIALLLPTFIRTGATAAARIQMIDVNTTTGDTVGTEMFAIVLGKRTRFEPPAQGPGSWTRTARASAGGAQLFAPASVQFAGNMIAPVSGALWTFHGALTAGSGVPGDLEGRFDSIGARFVVDEAGNGEISLVVDTPLGTIDPESLTIAFSAVAMEHATPFHAILEERRVLAVDASGVGSGGVRLDDRSVRTVIGGEGLVPVGCWHLANKAGLTGGRVHRDRGLESTRLGGLPLVDLRSARMADAIDSGRYCVVTFRIGEPDGDLAAQDAHSIEEATDPDGQVQRLVMIRWVRVIVPIDQNIREKLIRLWNENLSSQSGNGQAP
ncbi:MAG: hypothetical protein ACTS3F_14875 [Phycisphaerales bacterium]